MAPAQVIGLAIMCNYYAGCVVESILLYFSADEQFHVVCSDPDVVCQSRSVNRDEPREIFIKAPCGESPSIRRFYVSIYW